MVRGSTNKTRDRILAFIRSFIAENGYSPSVGDIVTGCGLSSPNLALLPPVQRQLERWHQTLKVESIRPAGHQDLSTT